eukprot:UN30573
MDVVHCVSKVVDGRVINKYYRYRTFTHDGVEFLYVSNNTIPSEAVEKEAFFKLLLEMFNDNFELIAKVIAPKVDQTKFVETVERVEKRT